MSDTRWELYDLGSSDNYSVYIEFHIDGTLSWYNIPDSYNGVISEKSTWEKNGNDLVFNVSNGFFLYEGKINVINGEMTIAWRYKTPLKQGDFEMRKL